MKISFDTVETDIQTQIFSIHTEYLLTQLTQLTKKKMFRLKIQPKIKIV